MIQVEVDVRDTASNSSHYRSDYNEYNTNNSNMSIAISETEATTQPISKREATNSPTVVNYNFQGFTLNLNSPSITRQQLIRLLVTNDSDLEKTKDKLLLREQEFSSLSKRLIYYQQQLKSVTTELNRVTSVLSTFEKYKSVGGDTLRIPKKGKGRTNILRMIGQFSAQTVQLSKVRLRYEELVNLIGGRRKLHMLKQDEPQMELVLNDLGINNADDKVDGVLNLDDLDRIDGEHSVINNDDKGVTIKEEVIENVDIDQDGVAVELISGDIEKKSDISLTRMRTRYGGKRVDTKQFGEKATQRTPDKRPTAKDESVIGVSLMKCKKKKTKQEVDCVVDDFDVDLTEVDAANPVNAYEMKMVNETKAEGEVVSHLEAYNSDGTKMHLYNCDTCGENVTPDAIVKHLREHPAGENTRPYICHYCGRSYLHNGGLKRHMIHHTDNKPTCTICRRTFTQWASLTDHMNFIHRGLKKHQCDICEKYFSHRGNLNTHMRIHTGDRPYICDICGRGFYESNHMKEHRRGHTGEKPFPCEICSKPFSTMKSLKMHVQIHNAEKSIICDLCGKGFHVMSNYKIHYKTHANPLPWSCKFCGKSYSHPSTLRSHELRHTQERDHLCTICGRGFFRIDHLQQHYNRHGNIKKHICSFCGKGFIDKVRLKYHQAVHTGDRPYPCDICGRKFTIPSILKTHKKIHQNKQ